MHGELEVGEHPPALRRAANTTGGSHEKGRALLVDDGQGSIGFVALRLVRLGFDVHYASNTIEARLFIAQEGDAIRMIAVPPTVDPEEAKSLVTDLAQAVGSERCFVVIGERPEDALRLDFRHAGVDWVLWSPFDDAELRYVMKSAMALREDLVERRDVRVPVDLIANIWSGDRQDVAVVSSLSPRGAFIELSNPLPEGSSLRIELEIGPDRFRGFARVVHVRTEDPARPNHPSGIGVTFYGSNRDEDRILRKAISERECRYLP
jgi:hypothetical protein